MTEKFNKDGLLEGNCDGSDTSKTKDYILPALAGRSDDGKTDTIIVDFSSKGGPADLHGVWNNDEVGITWSDGNTWKIVCHLRCPLDIESKEFHQELLQ